MALHRGDTGPLVLAAQVLLRVKRTGVFDAITELAVVQLQQRFGLSVNGVLDTAEYDAARHASSHASAGADPVALDQSQVSNLTSDLASKVAKAGDTMTGDLKVVKANARIGIGTATPQAPLEIAWDQNNAYNTAGFFSVPLLNTGNRVLFGVGKSLVADGYGWMGYYYAAAAADRALEWGHSGTAALMSLTKAGLLWVTSLKVGASGTALTQVRVYTPSLTPTVVSSGDFVEESFTVPGLSTADTIVVNPPAHSGAYHCELISCRVSAADTLTLTFLALSGAHSPPAGVYRILAVRS